MEEIKIYVLHSALNIGMIIPPTQEEKRIICEKCNVIELPRVYKNIHIEIDTWKGEDIIQAQSIFIVSENLKNSLVENDLKGFDFEPVNLQKSPYFYEDSTIEKTVLPNFWAIIINNRCKGPEVWWKRLPCNDCEKNKWDITEAGIASISVPYNTQPIPHRTVYKNSWKNSAIFYLEDPDASPIITENFLKILTQYNCQINLLDSEWV